MDTDLSVLFTPHLRQDSGERQITIKLAGRADKLSSSRLYQFTIDRNDMESSSSKLEIWAKRYVRSFFKNNISTTLYFHNIDHTEFVVEKCLELADYYSLAVEEKQALSIAAWFHDIGYCINATDHENYGVSQALLFLNDNNCPPELKEMTETLILSTRLPARPISLVQKIICDADMAHLGSPNYSTWAHRLKLELEHHFDKRFNDDEWNYQNFQFFSAHQYFSDYANSAWGPQKEKNLIELLSNRATGLWL